MKILLDTNFVLACAKQKIDFASLADELFDEKLEWIVPEEVLNELKEISERKGEKVRDKDAAEVGLQIIKKMKIKKIKLKNKNVDVGIANYISGKDLVLATLDRKLKSRVDNKIMTIRGKKSLRIIQ